GTLDVRHYLKNIGAPHVQGAMLASASVLTRGPEACFSGVLFIEKEGFMPLLEHVRLADRFDLAIMSTKGMSVTASRKLTTCAVSWVSLPLFCTTSIRAVSAFSAH